MRYVYDKAYETPLPVFGCFELKQFLKSKKDAERGNVKMPSDHFRINEMLKPYPSFQVIVEK